MFLLQCLQLRKGLVIADRVFNLFRQRDIVLDPAAVFIHIGQPLGIFIFRFTQSDSAVGRHDQAHDDQHHRKHARQRRMLHGSFLPGFSD